MTNIDTQGLSDLIRGWVDSGRPYLGICLGMQVLFDQSEESGGVPGLGILKGDVRKLPAEGVRVPRMGWNMVGADYMYFDHSYAVHPADDSFVPGWCDVGTRLAAKVDAKPLLCVNSI